MPQSPQAVAVAVAVAVRPFPQLWAGMTCVNGLAAYDYAWQLARVLAAQAALRRFDPSRN